MMTMNAVFIRKENLKSDFAAGNESSKRSPLLLDHVACCGYCTSDGDLAGYSTGKKKRCESCPHCCYFFSTLLIGCFLFKLPDIRSVRLNRSSMCSHSNLIDILLRQHSASCAVCSLHSLSLFQGGDISGERPHPNKCEIKKVQNIVARASSRYPTQTYTQ